MSKDRKCIKTLSKKHLWKPFEVNSSFTGTVGYNLSFTLKCAACGVVDDSDIKTFPYYISGERILSQLLGIKECRKEKKHLWELYNDPNVPSQKALCNRCYVIDFWK